MTFTQIDAAAAKVRFPSLVGPITGALVNDTAQVAIVTMGRGAWAVMANAVLKGICSNKMKAHALAKREADINEKHLRGAVRC